MKYTTDPDIWARTQLLDNIKPPVADKSSRGVLVWGHIGTWCGTDVMCTRMVILLLLLLLDDCVK